uniref:DUF4005 domain-containing protein n=1 Tax=Kalanchoe fedtschenkoi TaxID=63787 RepID=A0A7N0U6S0_KALFE
MRCMQALVRVQARVRARRLQLTNEKLRKKVGEQEVGGYTGRKTSTSMKPAAYEDWNGCHLRADNVNEAVLRKHEALMKKERALAYAYTCQQRDVDEEQLYMDEEGEAPWGWNWLERWMASQTYQGRRSVPVEGSHAATTDYDMSDKTVEMEMLTPTGSKTVHMSKLDPFESDPTLYVTKRSSSVSVPSYMAPTQSAKAKVRHHTQGLNLNNTQRGSASPQGAKWNPSTRGSLDARMGCDSSSSGGGTTTATAGPFLPQRSPSPKGYSYNGAQQSKGRKYGSYSPDKTSFGDRRSWPMET